MRSNPFLQPLNDSLIMEHPLTVMRFFTDSMVESSKYPGAGKSMNSKVRIEENNAGLRKRRSREVLGLKELVATWHIIPPSRAFERLH